MRSPNSEGSRIPRYPGRVGAPPIQSEAFRGVHGPMTSSATRFHGNSKIGEERKQGNGPPRGSATNSALENIAKETYSGKSNFLGGLLAMGQLHRTLHRRFPQHDGCARCLEVQYAIFCVAGVAR